MLAFGERAPAASLRSYTAHTIVDPDDLATALQKIRERGWALAYEERELGLNPSPSLFLGRRQPRGDPCPAGPGGPVRPNAARTALPPLLEAADAISRELGWRPG